MAEINEGSSFICARCEREFQTDQDDEAARAEFEAVFDMDPDKVETVVICDECHKEFMAWYLTKKVSVQ